MSDWDAGGEPVPVRTGDGRETSGRARDRGDEELAALVDELETTLRTLRTELDGREGGERRIGRRPRRDPPPLPRPPSPREVLRFTESYTIPTVVSLLEAAIRGLELLAATIRLLDGRDPRGPGSDDGNRVLDASGAAAERAAETGRAALERVDDALAELQRSYEGEPEDPTARRLLADARELRTEIDERLRAGVEPDGDEAAAPDDRPSVDVEAELASLREQAGRDGDDVDDADGADGT
jgi:hypothetical protein